MNPLSKFLAIGSYGIVSAALAAMLPAGAGMSGIGAILAGMCVFMFCIIVHMQFDRTRELAGLERRVGGLSHTSLNQQAELHRISNELKLLGEAVAALDVVTNREVVAEMRVLEELLQRLENRRAAPDPSDAAKVPALDEQVPEELQKPLAPLNVVSEALEANRVDLYLQPIVSLPQRKVRFYEGYSRIRDAQGGVIEPGQYISVAEQAGLISTIDNLLLLRCVQLIRRLHHRNRSAVIFCNISAHSLRDQRFFPQFVDFMEQNPDLAGSLIFEFAQDTVRENGEQEWAQLTRLAVRDYRFSMDRVHDLNMNFDELGRRNFHFIKVGAETLSGGMQKVGARLRSADLKIAMRRHGIDLIAEKIESEATVLELLDFELDYGQGYLFGEPRRSRGPEELSSNAALLSPARLAAV